MRRLAPLDKALVLILVPLWALCFGLGVKSQIEGRGLVNIGLSIPEADGYPRLTGEYAPIHASDPLEAAGLRAGDRLLRLPWIFATQGLFQGLMLWGYVRQANAAANAVIALGAMASVAVITFK